ncbi:hypothetical protein RhiirA5_427659 [Rhizophagus irregularis]|uniref:Uncharacterized protein n=1 Tax=Rhizophagus irregularis TaxID=588596 RepID=A0A2N0P1W7_9GLOM|nr:hypothetical protein RhiirA5_427659 [Rhizophagus irregularis]
MKKNKSRRRMKKISRYLVKKKEKEQIIEEKDEENKSLFGRLKRRNTMEEDTSKLDNNGKKSPVTKARRHAEKHFSKKSRMDDLYINGGANIVVTRNSCKLSLRIFDVNMLTSLIKKRHVWQAVKKLEENVVKIMSLC